MHKKYILPALIFVLAITAFTLNKTERPNNKNNIVKASLLPEKPEKRELTNAEKTTAFTTHAVKLLGEIKGNKPSTPVFKQALQAYYLLRSEIPVTKKNLLTIIDFSLPSTEKRLWIIDLEKKEVVENIVVSHGKNTGMNKAKKFSNIPNSFQSSLGAYITAETYTGKHGLSLRLDGVEEGINDNARARDIVIHTAAYANPSVIELQGRLGRSLGCPAIQENKIDVINFISEGSVMYIYGNDKDYLVNTKLNDIKGAFAEIEGDLI